MESLSLLIIAITVIFTSASIFASVLVGSRRNGTGCLSCSTSKPEELALNDATLPSLLPRSTELKALPERRS